MSLRDRWRGRGGENDGAAGSGEQNGAAGGYDADAGTAGALDTDDFAPRQDGDYHCVDEGLYLRFARPIVTETAAGAAGAQGEFTTSGRFTVQRPFARPIVYTVLAADSDSITMRRTDTGSRRSQAMTFAFEADSV